MPNKYRLMPFRFIRRDSNVLITGEAGEFLLVTNDDFNSLLNYTLSSSSSTYKNLKSKHLLADSSDGLCQAIDMTATKYRTKKQFLNNFTSLHMVVLTVRCNQKCKYCQVSCESEDAFQYDLNEKTAIKVAETIFKSPSPYIKIEFQGGEPTLNWSSLTTIIEKAEQINVSQKKSLSFVVCTNLTAITEDQLKYLKDHQVCLSTSFDGCEDIHNANRVFRAGGGTYNDFLRKLELTRSVLGRDKVDALMTCTSASIDKLIDVVNEYRQLGFNGIFLRSLNPYGFAAEKKHELSYSMEKYVSAYKECLDYLLELNMNGERFYEAFTTLLLQRILTPFATGFVDLQSPSGAGISGVIYDYNGDVYPADEARMLARMGDKYFLMGNIFSSSYHEIFNGKVLKNIVENSCLDIMPECSDCVFMPYCGADPIRNYLETGSVYGKRPGYPFCIKHKAIFSHLFDLILKNDSKVMNVLWSWINPHVPPLRSIYEDSKLQM